MKMMSKLAVALVAVGALVAAGPGGGAGKAHRLVGQGLLQVRGRRAATRRSRSSRTKTGVKVELSQYPVQDMIPKTVAALDAGTPPDVAYADVYDFQVTGKWAFDGKLEDITDVITPMKDKFLHEHDRDDVPLQRQDQEEGVLRVPAEAADDAHPVLEGHAGARRASRNPTSRPAGRTTGTSGATRCSRRIARRPASAPTRIGQPMGVDSSDSFYSFLTFVDAYNVKLVDDNGKLLVDDPKVRQGLDQRADGLHDVRTRKGCTPPSSTTLEGSRQQRRLPQQDDPDDAQRDDLDRRQVARRREQRRR